MTSTAKMLFVTRAMYDWVKQNKLNSLTNDIHIGNKLQHLARWSGSGVTDVSVAPSCTTTNGIILLTIDVGLDREYN